MLIGHAPAGYIVHRAYSKVRNEHLSFIKYGLFFSLWPDLDLIYFYFMDKKSTFHHLYFTHLPIALLGCLLLIIPLKHLKVFQKIQSYYYLFLVNWFIHLILDTFTGGIAWLYPLNSEIFTLIKIPDVYSHWIISFVLHRSFMIELIIVFIAVWLAVKKEVMVRLSFNRRKSANR
jgi:inner membrane protein